MTEKDPLDKIFTKPEDIDNKLREILADILTPFARIDIESGAFMPTILWGNLDSKRKILVFLVAKLALSTRKNQFGSCASPKDIEIATEIPGGTVRPKVIELLEEKIIGKDDTGAYYVKPSQISLIKIKTYLDIESMKHS